MTLRTRVLCLAATAFAILALCVAPALAEVGVGTDTGKIVVKDALPAGGSYKLPPFKLINAGDEATGYILKSVAMKGSKAPDPSWFTFSPEAVYLGPKQSAEINVEVKVPANAAPGSYKVLLVGEPSDVATQASGARVNIGAGPRLEMRVVSSSPLQLAWLTTRSWFLEGMPWTAVGVAAVILALAALAGILAKRRRPQPTEDDEDAEAA